VETWSRQLPPPLAQFHPRPFRQGHRVHRISGRGLRRQKTRLIMARGIYGSGIAATISFIWAGTESTERRQLPPQTPRNSWNCKAAATRKDTAVWQVSADLQGLPGPPTRTNYLFILSADSFRNSAPYAVSGMWFRRPSQWRAFDQVWTDHGSLEYLFDIISGQ
jgi:hypothetical protein